ncbi:MAG: DUF167 domain-containing protein [Desulfarculus sp.]|nr:MAG: DUF167 domain-containing protein [Desulfarculus sp.]
MLDIQTVEGGLSFPVRVSPRASRDQLAGEAQGSLKVRLSAPPVEGAANLALIRFLAKALGLPRSQLRLLAGHKSRQKRVLVQGLEPAQLLRRLGL